MRKSIQNYDITCPEYNLFHRMNSRFESHVVDKNDMTVMVGAMFTYWLE